jgi:hypothetical protein
MMTAIVSLSVFSVLIAIIFVIPVSLYFSFLLRIGVLAAKKENDDSSRQAVADLQKDSIFTYSFDPNLLHDRRDRDSIKSFAASLNINPISNEDTLLQIICMRSDIRRLSEQLSSDSQADERKYKRVKNLDTFEIDLSNAKLQVGVPVFAHRGARGHYPQPKTTKSVVHDPLTLMIGVDWATDEGDKRVR